MDTRYKGLRNASYVCQKLAIVGGIFWAFNAVVFFWQYFSNGMRLPDFRSFIEGYGGAIIAAIVPILLLYAAGGVINLLLDIEANTRKTS
jgi:hypothetical protein